jgi:L,D-transpeptidase ErfK/SrfK
VLGEVKTVVARHEDTLLDLGRAHGVGYEEIVAANPGVDPWVPGVGRRLLLPTAHILPNAPRTGIVINKAELRLYYFPKGGTLQHYAIGVGKEGFATPVGTTRIVRKTAKPTWRPTAGSFREKPWLPKVVPPGPDNPLGEYALYLGWPTYLVHGTNKPFGVGRRVSHGCIRMYPEGVEALFRQVPVGTRVTVVEQDVKVGWHQGELFLQAMPTPAQIDELEATYRTMSLAPTDVEPLIAAKIGSELDRVDWSIVKAEAAMRRGIPVQITRPRGGELLADLPTGTAASPASIHHLPAIAFTYGVY